MTLVISPVALAAKVVVRGRLVNAWDRVADSLDPGSQDPTIFSFWSTVGKHM